jgi:hypothetical protein
MLVRVVGDLSASSESILSGLWTTRHHAISSPQHQQWVREESMLAPLSELSFCVVILTQSGRICGCSSRHSQYISETSTMRSMHEGDYFTYIMTSRSHTLYVGVSGDLLKRVFQHKWKEHEG